MEQQDIRWLQRFSNYRKALQKLAAAVEIISKQIDWDEEVDDLLQEGLIQRFEYVHELAWKVMKDYEEYQGYTEIRGSRDAIRQALSIGLIDNDEWMDSIADRNRTSHDYDNQSADSITESIIHTYYPLFRQFEQKMHSISGLEPQLFEK